MHRRGDHPESDTEDDNCDAEKVRIYILDSQWCANMLKIRRASYTDSDDDEEKSQEGIDRGFVGNGNVNSGICCEDWLSKT